MALRMSINNHFYKLYECDPDIKCTKMMITVLRVFTVIKYILFTTIMII